MSKQSSFVTRYSYNLLATELTQSKARIMELEGLLDMVYHLRFVDDTISHEDNMKLWDKIENALSEKSDKESDEIR